MLSMENEAVQLFKNNARQTVKIKVIPSFGESFNLTQADILSGGFKLSRASVSGETVELGSVIASELSLSIDNYDGRFSEKSFEGARLAVTVGIADETKSYKSSFGYYNVDEVSKGKTSISVSALDDMVKRPQVQVLSLGPRKTLETLYLQGFRAFFLFDFIFLYVSYGL